jgi:transposase
MTTFENSTISSSQRAAYGLASPQSTMVLAPARGASASPAQAVQAAARAISSSDLLPVAHSEAGAAMHPRVMLAVLSFCYAFDIFASVEVELVMRRDTEFRRLCGNDYPDARTLRRFRRYNRESIERCLVEVLRGIAANAGMRPTDAELRDAAHERVDTAILMDMHEN